MHSLNAYLRVLRKSPYTILLPITFTTKKTEKTDESSAASLRPPTRAETAVEGKAVSVSYSSSAGI